MGEGWKREEKGGKGAGLWLKRKEGKKGGERCWVVVEMKIKGCWLRYCRWCRLLGLVWDLFSREIVCG